MSIKHVTVCGGGVLGSQIAFQTAFHGVDVRVYDISQEALVKTKAALELLPHRYQQDLHATAEQAEAVLGRIMFFTDLREAVKGAQLVIEAIPEVMDIKTAFYRELAGVADTDTIFATNTSTLLPSQMMEATGRPAQFLALHFANPVWIHNTAEIMPTPKTAPQVFDQVVAFARKIGMVALPLHKEQRGYIINTLSVPLLMAALKLVVEDVTDPHTVDKTWMIATRAPTGPFASLDVIGLTTAYNISKAAGDRGNEVNIAIARYLKEHYLDQGKLGVASGEGFYKYPDPAYLDEDFLKALPGFQEAEVSSESSRLSSE